MGMESYCLLDFRCQCCDVIVFTGTEWKETGIKCATFSLLCMVLCDQMSSWIVSCLKNAGKMEEKGSLLEPRKVGIISSKNFP